MGNPIYERFNDEATPKKGEFSLIWPNQGKISFSRKTLVQGKLSFSLKNSFFLIFFLDRSRAASILPPGTTRSKSTFSRTTGTRRSGCALIPNPETRIPNPETRIPKHETRDPNPETRIPEPETRIPKPESRIPNPESRNLTR
jgi:hypothetical protein